MRMSRKKKNIIHEQVEITAFASEGKSLTRVDDKVVFVPFTAPGDVVDLRVTRNKKAFAEAVATNFYTYSSLREEPKCSHFGTCGGCKWQHVRYEEQLKSKQQQVVDHLTRIGNLDVPKCLPIIACEETYFYRNKLEFTFTDKKWLTIEEIRSGEEIDRQGVGFHVPGGFDKVIDLEKCYLQKDPSNQIRDFIGAYGKEHELSFYNIRENEGLLRNLIIRSTNTGDLMVIVQFGEQNDVIEALMEALKVKFPEITSLLYIINLKKNETYFDQEVICYSGKPFIMEKLGDLSFKINPKSFFQTNSSQAEKLYEAAVKLAGLKKEDVVYDLYTGTGTIANFIARNVQKVIGIEYVEEAIVDAKENSKINNISNTTFFAGDMKDVLNDTFIKDHGAPNVIITDPPRAGMHPDVIETIKKTAPQRIVYVSCNVATQARDLALLADDYDVTAIQPVDMFPQTHHVENIVALIKK